MAVYDCFVLPVIFFAAFMRWILILLLRGVYMITSNRCDKSSLVFSRELNLIFTGFNLYRFHMQKITDFLKICFLKQRKFCDRIVKGICTFIIKPGMPAVKDPFINHERLQKYERKKKTCWNLKCRLCAIRCARPRRVCCNCN